jgi:hypothetical protein
VVRSSLRRQAARGFRRACVLVLVALAFPAAASAHSATATVTCTGVDYTWSHFAAGPNTVHWRVIVNGVTAQEGTQVIGTGGQLHVPLTLSGTNQVRAMSFWFANETSNHVSRSENLPGLINVKLTCATPPPPPPVVTTTVPPVTPASAVSPTVATQPAAGVLGTQAQSATARVSAQRRCATRSARITISGRLIRRVTFFVNGRRVRTVTVRAGQTRVTVSLRLRRSGASRQTVTARVTFRNGAASRTLTAHATRCAPVVRPNFTG